ncbi:hypothetical protein [Actinoplanes sp. CA-252034]|uniref:hypothetical protein n=1 Tax=Actinoplanes sp. CA-252034 TaxID=3239906 RepID=UPI003D98A1EC
MGIYEHVEIFAGLPVVAADNEEVAVADPGAVAWRISMEEFEAPPEEFQAAFEQLLQRTGPTGPTALIIGEWGSAYDSSFPYQLLIDNVSRLSGLRALFVGELTGEECEISWIHQADVTPLIEAFPALESLWIRGAESLELKPVRHEGLRELVFQSGACPPRWSVRSPPAICPT